MDEQSGKSNYEEVVVEAVSESEIKELAPE